MNGCSSSSFSIVNAEDHSMGGVVEGKIGIADETSPRKVVIKKVQAELSQKYRSRDETKQELEFLEKGGNLLDYKLQYAASASVQSTSATDPRNDRLATNDANGSSAFVTSSHGDPVETSGGPGVVPSEADSADNLMYFDAETKFFDGGRSLSHPCRNDVPLEPSLNINETQKHGDSAASTLPRKAYKRRHRFHPNRDGARSSSMNVDPSPGYEVEKQDTKLPLLSSSIEPVEGSLVKKESSGPPLYGLDGSKSGESMKNHVECVSRPTQPDYTDSSNPLHPQLSQEQPSAPRSPKGRGFDGLEGFEVIEGKTVSVSDNQLSLSSRRVDDQTTTQETNGFKEIEFEKSTDTLTSDPHAAGVLESDLANRATGINNGRINTNEIITTVNSIDSSASNKGQIVSDEASVMDIHKSVTSKNDHEENENLSLLKEKTDQDPPNLPKNGLLIQSIEGLAQSISNSSKLIAHVTAEDLETCHVDVSDPSRKHDDPSFENPNAHNEASCSIRNEDAFDANYSNPKQSGFPNMVSRVDENTILEEAQLIEAKRKRFMELSMAALPAKIQRRSHWDYVLEEMAWLSNDIAQERMWKIAAAAQTSFKAAVACRMRKAGKSSGMDAKIVARTLAKAVLEFWESVAVQGTDEITQQKNPRNNPIRAYAARLIVSHKPTTLADLSLKQDSTSDWELPDFPEDNTPHEQNFYTAPPGAMGTYRTVVISHVAHIEKTGSYVQDESEMSADGIGFESQDNLYDVNEGHTRIFDLPAAFDSNTSSKYGRKKLKRLKHGHDMGSYEASSDLPLQRSEIKLVKREPGSLTKRPGSSLNVPVPTKRVRTATRRVISPFNTGTSGSFQLQNKADASSGDTSSIQDDLSTFRADFVYANTLETDYARDYEKQTPFESAEVSTMSKKMAKHMNDDYDPRWQADSRFHEEQRDRFRRRSEAHLLESNGDGGLFGQPMMKKPKVLRQSRDQSFDNPTQTPPLALQFSNMHHPNKLIKILDGRDPGRKLKGPKIPTGQSGSENPWSVFEDQALVVLMHDHGPNWELISDAFNSALHFKCMFRNAEECKERHHTLMDRNSCDGADSAEDSGPSQPYPSALPGIPKGSARQLFQRLLGPVEEDTLKSHFEKIITIGQKLLLRRSQDPKQLLQPHSSHSAVLSQGFPNNLNGTSILTPLDLCDVVQGSDVFSTGMQVVHNAGPSGMNNPLLPASPGSAFQGSQNMVAGTSFPSPGFANSSARDGRHAIPRSGPLSADYQQKIQQYNQMVTGRNLSQATLPAHGALAANDRGVRINAGVIGSGNRSFPMARPGLQGTPTSLVNTGGMAPSAFPANMHASLVASHGSPISRSNDALQLMRPVMSQDSPRQIATGMPHPRGLSSPLPNQTASTPVSPYPINHQTTLPMSPQRPQAQHAYVDGQSNHAPTPPQQVFSPRVAKERQLQQRMMIQQTQQQFSASNSLARQVQSKPQLPLPSPIQTAAQPHPPKNSPVNLSSLPPSSSTNSMPQLQQKHQAAALGVVQNAQNGGNVVVNHTGKQQGRQHHLPQSSRHQPQRQHLQTPQQVKVAKGSSSGNVIPQPGDSSIPNGVMASPVTQPLDKREAGSQLVQNSSLNTGSTVSSMQPSSPSNSIPQQKFNAGQGTSAMKHVQTSKPDNGKQGHASPIAVPASNDGQQSCSPLVGVTSDRVLNLPNNRGSAISLSSNSCDTLPQEGQGLGERPTTIKNDANELMQQQSQVQKSPSQVSQMQNPSQPAQAPKQSPLLPAGNGNFNGRPDDPAPG